MSLIERLDTDLKQSMKDRDKFKTSVLRMIRSAIKYAEIEKRADLSEDDVLSVLTKEVKQRRESLHEFEKAERNDLVEKTQVELDILEQYLPEQLSEDELRKIIKDVIETIGATSKKDMGKVMGSVIPKVKGRADGKQINQIVQEYLV